MNFSEERLRHISHLILDALNKESLIEEGGNPSVLHDIKKVLMKYFAAGDEVDNFVRAKIHSYSRTIPEGSSEWSVMYDKLYEEEMNKRGFSS